MVATDKVTAEAVDQTAPTIGRFVTLFEAVVPALLASHVTEIPVNIGDRLAEGDIIAVLDTERLRWQVQQSKASLAQSEAGLAVARARAELAQRRLERAEGLRESTAFSQAQRDDARGEADIAAAQVQVAQAAVEEAKARLDTAADDYARGTVVAPFDGVVEERHADLGEAVQPGGPVVTLVSEKALEIEADVPSLRVAALSPGAPIGVTRASGETITTTVRAVGTVENPRTRTRRVRLVPELGELTNIPPIGEGVTVHVPISDTAILPTIHKDAILQRRGISVVYVVVDGKAEVRPVQLGDAVGERFVVLSGVQPGDVTVVRGNERLLPGQEVAVAPPPAEGGKDGASDAVAKAAAPSDGAKETAQ
ncbi:MAG: efflux RND transporter periplasmic adaptor subunit [Alphaproteobacteria bacterium]|nr:efflux RND transporter periplasmic adaptor subunit [Alphaproteobacteria bacterium]